MNNVAGFFLTFVAGTSVGISMWPLKWVRGLKWEIFWLLCSIFSLIVVPFALAFAVLPHLNAAYASLPPQQISQPFLMGLLWGVAQLGAGLCVHKLGVGRRRRSDEWHCWGLRNHHPADLVAQQKYAFNKWTLDFGRHCADAGRGGLLWITMIISGQFAGLMTGEWHSMTPRTYRSFSLGASLLVAAVLAIGTSKYLEAQ